ncbi:MAG TPA: glycosyl hydrolase family 18 protein [Terracidiphilus sp.]|nr:glycosyl hydrolase family 18 protein [Terracidiphilus sp.]
MIRGTRLLLLIAALMPFVCMPVAGQRPPTRVLHPLLVGYFPSWGLTIAQPFYVKTLADNGAAGKLDQINYSQGSVRNGRCALADPDADLSVRFTRRNSVNGKADSVFSRFRGNFHQLEELKRRYPHLKILISLEGEARDFAQDAQPENRTSFVTSCVDRFLRGRFAPGVSKPGLFDGIDIDWETPRERDAQNFLELIEEFRRQMKRIRPGLLLSIAVDESPTMQAGTDFAQIALLVDQVGVMNYDYAGPWNSTTGLLAPLFADDPRDPHSIEKSIAGYEAAGVPAAKLLMGLPFYGYSWTDVDLGNDGLFQHGRPIQQDRSYNHIRSIAPNFEIYREELSQSPWLFDGETFWTYDDPVSVRFKASYAAHQHLGGVMIWELSGDTRDAELLNITYRSLHDPLEEKVFVERARKHKTARQTHAAIK